MADGGLQRAQIKPLQLDGVKVITSRYKGAVKFYYRHVATKTQLGSSDDHEAVQIAHDALAKQMPVIDRGRAGTFDQIVRDYYASSQFLERCDESTRGYHREHLEPLREHFGQTGWHDLTAKALEDYLKTLIPLPDTRYKRLKAMRLVLNWAVERPKEYGLTFSVADQVFVPKPPPRTARWTVAKRKTMYDGLPEAERPALYKSVAERNRQKKHLRDALRDLGVIGDDKPRIDYDMTIEELDALYRSKCAELGHAQQKIFDGLTLHQRAKLYPAALFTDEDRRRADQRGLYMRIASLLAYYLAQRRGDLLDLARSQNIALAAGGAPDTYLFQANDMRGRQWVFAHIVQNKTGAVVEIPLHPKLEAALREHVWRGDYLLSSPAGDHWDEHNFSQCWREECELLGIEDVTLHDLRRTIRSDLAEAACTDEEICAITGHKIASINNNDMADIYTVRNREMAINALEKLIAWEAKVEEFALRREALGITGDEVGDVDFLRQPKLLPAPKKKKRGTA